MRIAQSTPLERVLQYYDQCRQDYARIWHTDRHFSMHAGYAALGSAWQGHDAAVVRMIEALAQEVGVTAEDWVLDMGCGYGGSVLWLAEHRGCQVTGVDINLMHLEGAAREVMSRGLVGKVHLLLRDMEHLGVSPVFTVAWSLEASCYVQDKGAFLRQVYQVLRPGGRVVIADGFQRREHPDMRRWLDGFAVPNLATVAQLAGWLGEAGFVDVFYRDITVNVLPSSRRLYRIASLLYPVARLLELARKRSKVQTGNVVAAIYQHRTLTRGLWEYGIFTARRAG